MFIRLPQAHNSLIRNNIYITLLKKLKQKKCTVVNTKMMPLASLQGSIKALFKIYISVPLRIISKLKVLLRPSVLCTQKYSCILRQCTVGFNKSLLMIKNYSYRVVSKCKEVPFQLLHILLKF